MSTVVVCIVEIFFEELLKWRYFYDLLDSTEMVAVAELYGNTMPL